MQYRSSAVGQPVRHRGSSANYYSILTGNGPIAKFFFQSGRLVALNPTDPQGSTHAWVPIINTSLTANGCATFGQLGLIYGGSTNKCASYNTFGLQSNEENSQLGAHLVFNWTGGLHVCGAEKEVRYSPRFEHVNADDSHQVWYKLSPSDGPSDCTPIELYTVPVVE